MGSPYLSSSKLFLITTLLCLSLSVSESELCHPNDKKALLNLKAAFNNPYVLSSWDPHSDCCEWHLVACHRETNRIDSLVVSGGLSAAQIPPEIGELTYLSNLALVKHANLRGSVPPAIANLTNLQYLTISRTNVSGSIPDFLAQMTSLRSIDLSSNSFTGPIPASLANLPSLGSLHLDRNKLTGPIPDSFGSFGGEDFYLDLSRNQLSGKIPASLGNKRDFASIDLSHNALQGDASPIFASTATLHHLDASWNALEFELSKVRRFSRDLVWLDLSHNWIFGGVPPDLAELASLEVLNLSYNKLCGKIPVGGELQRIGAEAYSHNRCLCGSPLKISCK